MREDHSLISSALTSSRNSGVRGFGEKIIFAQNMGGIAGPHQSFRSRSGNRTVKNRAAAGFKFPCRNHKDKGS